VRVVITGGGGFIGRALTKSVLENCAGSDEVILVDSLARHGRRPGLEMILSDERVSLIEADLSVPNSLKEVATQVDQVYHLAARVGVGAVTSAPVEVLKSNTLSTMHVFEWFLESASIGGRLLYASTSEVYSGGLAAGLDLPIPTPESVPIVIPDIENPRFSYALSKMWGEAYAQYLAAEDERFVTVRYHNVYGPDMGYEHVIPQIVTRVRDREKPFRMFGADETRSFCWVGDAALATRKLMNVDDICPGTVVHIGNQAQETRIGDLYDMIFRLSDWSPEETLACPSPPGSVQRRCPDVTALREHTGYEPSTTLVEGLVETVNWYLENGR